MRYIFFLISLVLFSAVCSAQKSRSPKSEMDRFLATLLVHKKVDSVKKHISTKAYKNEALLSADCIGTLDKNITEENGKKKINTFFKMLVKGIKGDNLKTILNYGWADDTNLETVQAKSLASPKKNGYLLLLAPKLIEKGQSDAEGDYIKSHYPRGPYLILMFFVKIADKTDKTTVNYPVYFLWQKENGQWKIVHINTMCT